ncbi:short chain dehydrogenase reductase [Grosmannia clavigera kw1407]|uniref:Short chain dehydrogenase reductase n=1 Tax=Grosmannia clavigera (strain kw1407 / UAMH 11150) TaxID=655863 RepID=F0XNP1_GROCL|nr:short chain dehydrogenase reductase [Grosmannia clavigera kw1407]EFX00515.1 short chain dehydrogenase reductase [Grosmannia clavigera kw1407]
MVSDKVIQASNSLISDTSVPHVAVFIGGLSGIGKSTVRALIATGTSMRIYLVGRNSAAKRVATFIKELNAINRKAEVVWTDSEVALLAETKRICEVIKDKESSIGLLFFGTGYDLLSSYPEKSEVSEVTQSLEYFQRMLFLLHLLPLLRKAESARVISILGGRPGASKIGDAPLIMYKGLGNFKAMFRYSAIHMTMLEKMAVEDPAVTFVHSWPGWVRTEHTRRNMDSEPFVYRILRLIFHFIVGLFSVCAKTSGQRHLFISTSAAFGGHGVPWFGKPGVNSLGKQENGLFLVNHQCNCALIANALDLLREKAQNAIWAHTQEVLEPYM